MKYTKVTLAPLTADDREQFILDNQWAFKHGALLEFGEQDNHIDEDGEIISRQAKVLSIYHKGTYDRIGEAYAFLMKYAEQNGYKAVGLPRECYIDGIWNKESEEEWLTEIQLPVE